MRKLASIRLIDSIDPIENADAIEVATVGGWKVVVKKGEFKAGDFAVYCEIDSFIPHEVAPFLSKGKDPKEFEGIKGERLRTIRLRGQLSQGLLLPLHSLSKEVQEYCQSIDYYNPEGIDLTKELGIIKWEPKFPAQLAGNAKGNFPQEVPKTDQERIQNVDRLTFESYRSLTWEVTEKLHGASCTFYLDNNSEFHVCSRNLDLKEDENNSYWKAARKYDIESKLRLANLKGFAIQGEIVGEGINGNQYTTTLDFYVFDMYETHTHTYASPEVRQAITNNLNLKHVPVLTNNYEFKKEESIQSLLELAEGKSKLNGSDREGLVFKSMLPNALNSKNNSFKVISNKWLLNEK
jgi:RNA ligase (TIGR02306 family)